jgi:hypothetical protein
MPVMKPLMKPVMKPLMKKAQRGYLLLEMVVCGALAAVILAGILSQLVRARNLNVATGRDVIASQLVLERLEIARNTPFGSLTNGSSTTDTPLIGYTRTTAISASCSETMTFPAPAGTATVACKDITVTVTFRMNQTGAGTGLQTRTSQATTRIYQ